MMGGYDHGSMMGNMAGIGLIGMIWAAIMLLIIIGGILLIVYIVKNNNKRRHWSTSSSALNILKERFARGEIGEDEYVAKKEVLEREDRN